MISLNWLDRKTALLLTIIYLGVSLIVLLIYRSYGSPDLLPSSNDRPRSHTEISAYQVSSELGQDLNKSDFIMIVSDVLSGPEIENIGYLVSCDVEKCTLELFPNDTDHVQVANDLREKVFFILASMKNERSRKLEQT